jgi:hypothetical protein
MRDDLNNGVGCRPPELRTNLLKLHQIAMTIINNGSRSQATEMFDLAMDLAKQVSNMMTHSASPGHAGEADGIVPGNSVRRQF